ncbi:MAG: CoA transferase, partial [Geminicoccaceae bacterium]|nr:CoA transferase [Geminicoccaceae bacterium]
IVAAGNDLLFKRLAVSLERPELASDPRFLTNRDRVQHVDELTREIGGLLIRRPRAEWLQILEAAGVPSGPLNDVAEAMVDPQILARNMVVESDHPVAGRLRMAGNPIKVEGIPDPTERPPAPELDQDRDSVLAELPKRA